MLHRKLQEKEAEILDEKKLVSRVKQSAMQVSQEAQQLQEETIPILFPNPNPISDPNLLFKDHRQVKSELKALQHWTAQTNEELTHAVRNTLMVNTKEKEREFSIQELQVDRLKEAMTQMQQEVCL